MRLARRYWRRIFSSNVTNDAGDATCASHPAWKPLVDFSYDGSQSPAAGPASGRVSPESHDAIATINAWS